MRAGRFTTACGTGIWRWREAEPERFVVIDGRAPIGEVAQQIREALRERV